MPWTTASVVAQAIMLETTPRIAQTGLDHIHLASVRGLSGCCRLALHRGALRSRAWQHQQPVQRRSAPSDGTISSSERPSGHGLPGGRSAGPRQPLA